MNLLQNWKSRLIENCIAWLIRRNTMVGLARIQNLSRLVQRNYGDWPGCRRAVDEFFQTGALSHPLQPVDRTAHWFQKL